MRLLHCSDLHIGFRAFPRLTPTGGNQREADVAQTFSQLIERVIALEPELIAIAGDVFHNHHPQNQAILDAFAGFSRLVTALPDAIVIMVAGNHDVSNADGWCLLPLFAHLGVHVVHGSAVRLRFAERDVSVLCVPDAPGIGRPSLRPDPASRFNVLVMHGEAAGVRQTGAERRVELTEISAEELGADTWDYVALGHYHQFEHVAPNAAYSGSIDYTSTNIWDEAATPKGFIERDLSAGAETFHRLPSSRRVVDVPPIVAADMTAADIDSAIRSSLESIEGGIDGAIVRLVVDDISRELQRSLDLRALREFQRRCLHLSLDFRRPAVIADRGAPTETTRRRRPSLRELLLERLSDPTRFPLAGDVDRDALMHRALGYLDSAGEAADPAAAPEPSSVSPASKHDLEANPLFQERGAA